MARSLSSSVILLLASVALLVSCSDEDCVCPDPLDPAPTGWFAQSSPTDEILYEVVAIDTETAVAVGTGGTILKTVTGGE